MNIKDEYPLDEEYIKGNNYEKISMKQTFNHKYIKSFAKGSEIIKEDKEGRFWKYDPVSKNDLPVTDIDLD